LEDVAPHVLKAIEHFFQVYKDLENKETKIEGWKDADFAAQLYEECQKRYQENK
jgi:inorganic pyrophosphatase